MEFFIILIIILWILDMVGLFVNLIYKHIFRTISMQLEITTKKDASVKKIDIPLEDSHLIGYVRNTGGKERKKVIIYLTDDNQIAFNSVYDYGRYFDDYIFVSVDYFGIKESKGKRTERNILETGMQVYDYMYKQSYVDRNCINIIGYGYGTGIAAYLASRRWCNALILISPYREIVDIYNRYVPIFYGPMRVFVTENFQTKVYANTIIADTLFITSAEDDILYPKYSYELQKLIAGSEVKEYKGINHNEYMNNKNVLKDIYNYINERNKEDGQEK